ncbi:hypothetical protein C8Q75DRAFT_725389 [Abortiporus biennis]|nr:hypothetical protein C8Q75DRAFT_725389 [Abortiporus biennis]
MPSYFRNLFGGSNNQNSTSSSKTHSRSRSATANIYAPSSTPGTTPSQHSSTTSMGRSHSYSASSQAPHPSPLRFATGTSTPSSDTRTAYGYGRRPSHGSRSSTEPPVRPQVLRRASHQHHQQADRTHYPIYTSGAHITPASSRSNSSSSVFTSMGSAAFMSTNSDSGHHYYPKHPDVRPPLHRSNHTWHPGSSAGSASSLGSSRSQQPAAYAQPQPRPTTLHMHPLLAYTRLHRAPLSYDVTFTPSARTVLDRTTHSAIPSHTLSQPATDPPTPSSSRLVLRCDKFPWPIVVGPSGPRFTIGPAKHSHSKSAGGFITNLDVLYAVHTTLLTAVTPEEWESLGHGSKKQAKVTKAYEKRCTRMGGGWEGGVKRIDWLGSKTRLVGVEVDKSAGRAGGKLVFSKA